MRNPLTPLLSGSPGRRRLAWVLLVIGGLALAGLSEGGKKLVEAYEGLTSVDRAMRFSAWLSNAEGKAVPVTMISIDDETRAKWNIRTVTPHAAIAGLIGIARKNGARAILVDMDLSSDVPDQQADETLGAEIHRTPPAEASPSDKEPLLMFVRAVEFRPDRDRGHSAHAVNTSPYDNQIDGGMRVWVSAVPHFTGDRVVRKIKLWQTVCDGAAGKAYASPALYIAAYVDAPRERRTELKEFLTAQSERECGNDIRRATTWPKRSSADISVQFVIGANAEDASGKSVVWHGERVPLFQELYAWTLVSAVGPDESGKYRFEPVHAETVDDSAFRGRVVVIGATHAGVRDIYATPRGAQTGAMILANSVAAAHAMVGPAELPRWVEGLAAVALFILFAVIGAKLQLVVATFVVGLISVALATIAVGQIGFDSTVRILALALTLYTLQHVVRAIIAIVAAWRSGLGWRALLVGKVGH